jgi:hypothetical protein
MNQTIKDFYNLTKIYHYIVIHSKIYQKNHYKILLLLLVFILFFTSNANAQNALDFDGSDDRVICGKDSSINLGGKSFCLEAWIFPTAWKPSAWEGNIINKEDNSSNNGYMMRCGDGGKLNCAFGQGTSTWVEKTTATAVLKLNTWQHVAFTYNGTKAYFYVDGNQVDSMSSTAAMTKATGVDLVIGDHSGTYTRRYQGKIDEVKIWAKYRTQTDIKNDMNGEYCAPQQSLRAYYKFNHGKAGASNTSVKTLSDLSGYGNNGVVANFALSGSTSNWVSGKTLTKGTIRDTIAENRCDRFRSPSGKFTWTKGGVYKDTLPTYFGCDSALTIHLTLRYKTVKNISAWACKSYTSPSGAYTWTKSGTYTDYLVNSVGCDSVINVSLSIGGTSSTFSANVCNSYLSPLGRKLTETGIYVDTTTNYKGCDSFIIIDLIVRKTTYSTQEKKFCTPFRVPSRKYFIYTPGVYYDTLENAVGCDSIITIKAISLATYKTIKVTVCDRYKSPSERYYWSKTGSYKDTVLNSNFCDSIVTVNLTVLGKTYFSYKESACKLFKLPSGKNSYTKSAIIQDTIKNHLGCDSVITIDLIVIKVGVGVLVTGDVLTCTNTSATDWQWVLCNQNYKPVTDGNTRIYNAQSNGNYAVVVTQDNCSDTSECFWITSASVGNFNSSPSKIRVYPNPIIDGITTITVQSPVQVNRGILRLINSTGTIITVQEFQGQDQQITIPNRLTSGVYIIELYSENWQQHSYLSIVK